MNPDGTREWPYLPLTPIDRVALAMADVMRARVHVDNAMAELAKAIERLAAAAKGEHR